MTEAADRVTEGNDRIDELQRRSFPSYSKYSDSGVEWLGEIPEHWQVQRLKYLATLNDEALPESTDPNFEMSYVDISSVDALAGITKTDVMTFEKAPSRARRIVRHGDVIVSTVRTYLRAIAAIEAPASNLIVSTGFAVLRPRGLDSSFASYALRAPHFVERVVANSVGVSYPAINASSLACFAIAYPDVHEQRLIAGFLDRETARIDALVARKERLIELLQEKRTALITRAVTRGLDPNVPMKDSGVEWLGAIPAHWEVSKIKSLPRPGYKTFVDGDWIESPYITADGIRLIQTGNIGSGEYREQGFRYISEETFNKLGCTEVEPDDILICRLGEPVARACLAPQLGKRMITSVDVCILKLHEEANAPFLVYSMSCCLYLDWVGSLVRGSTRDRVSRSMLGSFVVPFPPTGEQRAIAAFLERKGAKIDSLIANVQQAIDLLKEFRTALISAAVTGKIDVREEAT